MHYKTLRDIKVKGKRVLIRTDFNVPIDANGIIQDDSKIRATLPTIRYILDQGGSVILMSHLGRPEGKRMSEYSLAPVALALSNLLQRDVGFIPDCVGEATEKLCSRLANGGVLLLE